MGYGFRREGLKGKGIKLLSSRKRQRRYPRPPPTGGFEWSRLRANPAGAGGRGYFVATSSRQNSAMTVIFFSRAK